MERVDKILAHPEFQVYMRRIREQERTRVAALRTARLTRKQPDCSGWKGLCPFGKHFLYALP